MKFSGVKLRVGLAAALVAMTCLAGAGCSSGAASTASSEPVSSESQEASSSASAEAVSEGLEFGTKTATSLSIVFANETGSGIVGLSAVPEASPDSPVQLMGAGDALPAGEKATVHLEPAEGDGCTLSFEAGGTAYQLHAVDFSRIDEASICVEGDVAYLALELDGNAITTLQEEYDRAHPTVAEPANEAPANEEPVVYYEDVAAEEAPAQEEDACVSDVILN